MKKLIASAGLCWTVASAAVAQNTPADSAALAKSKFLAIGTASVGVPVGELAKIANTGIYFSSGLEYRATRHLTVLLISEVWTTKVTLPPTADQNFTVKGRSNNLLVSLNLGYYRTVQKWTFYGFGGLGVGIISRPNVAVENPDVYDIAARSETKLIYKAGLGIEYKINPTLVPYVEISYGSSFDKTILGDRVFSYASVGVGVKAYVKVRDFFKK